MRLSHDQALHILEAFERTERPQAFQAVWSRRSYAPMHIHEPALASLRTSLRTLHPEYVPMFDVVFESQGHRVDWHCDYESLGPFEVDDYPRAIAESHFMSVHFNLTEEGGALTTLPWVWLSCVHYACIVWFGIFSLPHHLLNALCAPLFALFGKVSSNAPRIGNVFDNMRLHSVSTGKPRISYVVRMAKAGCVHVTRKSIENGIRRSAACAAFTPLLTSCVADEPLDVADVAWSHVFSKSGSD